jgi:hypothetical protein
MRLEHRVAAERHVLLRKVDAHAVPSGGRGKQMRT